MKKILISLFFFFCAVTSSNADSNFSLPEQFSVRERLLSLTKEYDIQTKTQKLGRLHRPFLSLFMHYEFFDPMDIKTATAKARIFSLGANLDIYDQTDTLLGSVEEKLVTLLPTFEIISSDKSTKLARAKMNFFGTKFFIFDPDTNEEMILMSRSYLRIKNNWNISITNKALLDQKNIDPTLLMTVLAAQGEIEDWQNTHLTYRTNANTSKRSNALEALSQEIAALNTQDINAAEDTDPKSLEALAEELEQGFNAENPSTETSTQNTEEQAQAFIRYCINQITSPQLSNARKKAIITLLNLRIRG